MRRLREILLTQHIGAITIGLVLAQAVLAVINAAVQNVAAYIALQGAPHSVMSEARPFSWVNLEISLATATLELLTGIALIFWLYGGTGVTADHENESPDEMAEV